MKPIELLVIVLLLIQSVSAQQPPGGPGRPDTPAKIHYGMLSIGSGLFFPRNPGSPFITSFQYSSTSIATGMTTIHSFSGTSGGFLSTPITCDVIHGAYVFKHNSIDAGIGFIADMKSIGANNFQGKAGYGYILRFGCLQVQPAIDVYLIADGPAKLGGIDNNGVDLSVLGFPAHSRYYFTSFDPGTFISTTTTVSASYLEIEYWRTSWLIEPKLGLSTFLWRNVYVSIEGGWVLQLAQINTLELIQDRENVVGKVHFGNNGSLRGPGAGITIGWCFGGMKSLQRKH